MEVIDLEQRNRDLTYDVERYKRTSYELEERIEQQKAVKDNLRRKVKDNEENMMVMTKEMSKCQHENKEAQQELAQFRDDVCYQTKETSALLDDLNQERKLRVVAEAELARVRKDSSARDEENLENLRLIDDLRHQNQRILSDCDQQRDQITILNQDKRDYSQKLDQLKRKLNDMQGESSKRNEAEHRVMILEDLNDK